MFYEYKIKQLIIPGPIDSEQEGFSKFKGFTIKKCSLPLPRPLDDFVPLELTTRELISRLNPLSFVICSPLLKLAETCRGMHKIVNGLLGFFTSKCLETKLQKSIFSDINISYEEVKQEKSNALAYQNYIILLFFSAKYIYHPQCKAFQKIFYEWYFLQPSIGEVKEINEFRLELLKKLILKGFTNDPNHQLCVIKKLVNHYLDLEYESDEEDPVGNCIKQLIKNTTLCIDNETMPTSSKEATRTIDRNSFNWIVKELNTGFDSNNEEKIERAFGLLTIIVEKSLLFADFKDVQFVKRIISCSKTPSLICSVQLVLKKMIKQGIEKECLNFLDLDYILFNDSYRNRLKLFKALAQHPIFQDASEFRELFIAKIIKCIDDFDQIHLAQFLKILAENKILINYPMHYEVIFYKLTSWDNHLPSLYFINMFMKSLVENKIFIYNDDCLGVAIDCFKQSALVDVWNWGNIFLDILDIFIENELFCMRYNKCSVFRAKIDDLVKNIEADLRTDRFSSVAKKLKSILL